MNGCLSPAPRTNKPGQFVEYSRNSAGFSDTQTLTKLIQTVASSPKVKRDLSDRIASVLRRLTPCPEGLLEQLSVELVDMDRES